MSDRVKSIRVGGTYGSERINHLHFFGFSLFVFQLFLNKYSLTIIRISILLFHENCDEWFLYTQDGKFRETLQSDGEGSLEERSFTLVSGTTLVDVSYSHYTAPSCKIAEVILIYCFMRLNKVKPTEQLGATVANYCCQWFWYTCTCMEFRFLWTVALIC